MTIEKKHIKIHITEHDVEHSINSSKMDNHLNGLSMV